MEEGKVPPRIKNREWERRRNGQNPTLCKVSSEHRVSQEYPQLSKAQLSLCNKEAREEIIRARSAGSLECTAGLIHVATYPEQKEQKRIKAQCMSSQLVIL
ncbi:hypothetical protein P7K49_024645 [Saguinus oedipus]|uniref:Uncharacterized protein n=1 Tax=Saguinus oedipus TaxID=9490 RepID=A0ABQ9UQ31_SAGOE|nr:hypothetical protein P7K49_024645 [Saguinus oedipus]